MTEDEHQSHATREAALAIGAWLEGRGNLHHPIRALTLGELEAMAARAIGSWVGHRTRRGATEGRPTQPDG